MSKPIPSALAIDLSSVADGNTADATPVASALVALEAALNQLSAALSSGTSGQFLQAVDGTDVVWGQAADLAKTATQTFLGGIMAKQLGVTTGPAASVSAGAIAITTSQHVITATDASTVRDITGRTGTILFLRNATVSDITFATGGSSGTQLAAGFILKSTASVFLLWDGSQPNGMWQVYALTTAADKGQTAAQTFLGPIGYATGAGGAVTQLTSQATGVTLNKICGTINTFNAAVNAGAEFSFVVTNSTVAAGDVVAVSGMFAGCVVSTVAANGSFTVTVHNASGSNNTGSFAINFAVIKAVSA